MSKIWECPKCKRRIKQPDCVIEFEHRCTPSSRKKQALRLLDKEDTR